MTARQGWTILAVLALLALAYLAWANRYDILSCDFPNCLARDLWTGDIVLIRPTGIRR